jgi:hypothetical protein
MFSLSVTACRFAADLFTRSASAEEVFFVRVEAGKHDRVATRLSIPLPKSLHDFKRLGLCRSDDRGYVEGQVVGKGKSKRLVWQLEKKLSRGTTRTFEILPLTEKQQFERERIVCEQEDGKLQVRIGDNPVLDYNVATQEPPEGLPEYYRRSGYIHPLYSPSGKVVTGDFSNGHVHQHALFFAWTKAKFEDRAVEFWNQKLQLGQVEHMKVLGTESGGVVGKFQASLRHSGLNDGKVTPILNEKWDVTISNRSDVYVIDLETTQECATKNPLTIEKYHYGGMALRGTSQWELEKGKQTAVGMLTSDGADRLKGNHSRPNWVALFGPIDGEMNGVAGLSHPDNFRAPQYVRLHPTRPYFCFSPMVEKEFSIEPAKPFRARYRFIVYSGDTDKQMLQSLWSDFADPPVVTVDELEE